MKSSYKLEDYKFQHTLQTRWKDLDAFRHINNAVFLSYIEDARIILLKRWKINYDKKSLIVASVKIDYLKQVNHPSSLAIGQRVSRRKQEGKGHYSSCDEMVGRLDVLIKSKGAGNSDNKLLHNEIVDILDGLLKNKSISKAQHKKLSKLYHRIIIDYILTYYYALRLDTSSLSSTTSLESSCIALIIGAINSL